MSKSGPYTQYIIDPHVGSAPRALRGRYLSRLPNPEPSGQRTLVPLRPLATPLARFTRRHFNTHATERPGGHHEGERGAPQSAPVLLLCQPSGRCDGAGPPAPSSTRRLTLVGCVGHEVSVSLSHAMCCFAGNMYGRRGGQTDEGQRPTRWSRATSVSCHGPGRPSLRNDTERTKRQCSSGRKSDEAACGR